MHVKAPHACRKELAELIDANDRRLGASRSRRGSRRAPGCTELNRWTGDRGFESSFLQRRVLCEPVPMREGSYGLNGVEYALQGLAASVSEDVRRATGAVARKLAVIMHRRRERAPA